MLFLSISQALWGSWWAFRACEDHYFGCSRWPDKGIRPFEQIYTRVLHLWKCYFMILIFCLLVQFDDPYGSHALHFFLESEVVPLCLKCMDVCDEMSRKVSPFCFINSVSELLRRFMMIFCFLDLIWNECCTSTGCNSHSYEYSDAREGTDLLLCYTWTLLRNSTSLETSSWETFSKTLFAASRICDTVLCMSVKNI